MKVKRQKHVRRCLTFYKNNFSFETPFRILVDGTFCKAALTCQVNIQEQVPKYLDSEVKLYTTKCVMAECEALGSLLYGPLKVLKQYDVCSCGHADTVSAARCLLSLLRKRNKNKFFIATQDQELTQRVRKSKGVPLLYISHNTITMEAPSEVSKRAAEHRIETMTAPSDHAQSVIKQLKLETFGEEKKVQKKRKGPKGPNPLSCKKKRKRGKDGKVKKKIKKKKLKVTADLQSDIKKMLSGNS